MIKKLRSIFNNKDHGFSLLEVSIAIGIMTIGTAIAIPSFTNALESASANEVKAQLAETSIVLENARLTNEGLYPTSFTDEMIANDMFKSVRYTYSDDQQEYCIMAISDSNQKYFISSDGLPSGVAEGDTWGDVYRPSVEAPGCTLSNVGYDGGIDGSTKPLMSSPVISIANNAWDFQNGASAAAVNFSWGQGTCISDPNSNYVAEIQGIQYQVRWANNTSTTILQYGGGTWSNISNVNGATLDGWLPNDKFTHQVRMRCVADFEVYYSDWIISNQDTVDAFDVSKTITASTPTPSITWDYGTDAPQLSLSVVPITCPSGFSPIYRLKISQSGSSTITTDWQAGVIFVKSLTNFSSGTRATWVVDDACSLNATTYIIGTLEYVGQGTVEALVPPKAPGPVANMHCETKYDRLNELNLGNCDYNAALTAQTYTPDAIRWDASVCSAGYSPRYLVSRWSGATSAWGTAETFNSNLYPLTSNPIPGTQVKYKVYAVCTDGSLTSVNGPSSELTFTTSWPEPSIKAFAFSWTPSTVDTSFASTALEGDSYMYDKVSASTTDICSNGTAPKEYVYQVQRQSDGTASGQYYSNALNITRSGLAGVSGYWVEGDAIKVRAQVVCGDPLGDYDDVTTVPSNYSSAILIGYQAPSAVSVSCKIFGTSTRLTEATKGNCTASAAITNQTYAPDLVNWSTGVCKTNYTPKYQYIRNGAASGQGVWSAASTSTSAIPDVSTANTATVFDSTGAGLSNSYQPSYTYTVKYYCEGNTGTTVAGRTSAVAPTATLTFKKSYDPVTATNVAIASTTTTTGDTSWTPTTAVGADSLGAAKYLYDRNALTSTTTCAVNGSTPTNYDVQTTSYNGTTTVDYSLLAQTDLVINRSEIETSGGAVATYWPEGSQITMAIKALCSDPFGDYTAVKSAAWSATSTAFETALQAPVAAIKLSSRAANGGWIYWTGASSTNNCSNNASTLQYWVGDLIFNNTAYATGTRQYKAWATSFALTNYADGVTASTGMPTSANPIKLARKEGWSQQYEVGTRCNNAVLDIISPTNMAAGTGWYNTMNLAANRPTAAGCDTQANCYYPYWTGASCPSGQSQSAYDTHVWSTRTDGGTGTSGGLPLNVDTTVGGISSTTWRRPSLGFGASIYWNYQVRCYVSYTSAITGTTYTAVGPYSGTTTYLWV